MNTRSRFCVAVRRILIFPLFSVPWLAQAQPGWLPQPPILTFDAPGGMGTIQGGCAGQCGTFPVAISPNGTIVGNTVNASSVSHGFVRTPDCQFLSVDPPGSTYTSASDIDPQGAITGYFRLGSSYSGFLRDRHGRYTAFSVPGATNGTFPGYFTPSGEIVGHYSDASGTHGFLLDRDGEATKFTVLSSALTMPQAVSPAGVIVGYYSDGGTYHGFLRTRQGTITTFDPPGSSFTIPTGVDGFGAVTGYYLGAMSQYHGFLRAPDGSFTTFDPSGSTITVPESIDLEGLITGHFFDPNSNENRGFVRNFDGSITAFSVSSAAPENAQGTMPSGISVTGAITGSYIDSKLQNHGFLRAFGADHCSVEQDRKQGVEELDSSR